MLNEQQSCARGGASVHEAWADIVRTIAILLVLWNHAVEYVYDLNTAASFNTYGFKTQVFTVGGFILGRLGVPLFLFLTGYFCLNKKIDSTIGFYKRSLSPLIATITAWTLLLLPFFDKMCNLTCADIFQALIFWKQIPYMQFWYVPYIVGVYIGIPLVNAAIRTFSGRDLLPIFILCFFCSLCLPTIDMYFTVSYPQLSRDIWGGYGYTTVYLLTGYYVGKQKVKFLNKMHWLWLLLLSGTFCVLNSIYQFIVFQHGIDWKFGYDSVFQYLGALFLFAALMKFKATPKLNVLKKICEKISILSFGAYFLHAPVQDILLRIGLVKREWPATVITLFLMSTVITFTILFVIEKIPVINQVLLKTRKRQEKLI